MSIRYDRIRILVAKLLTVPDEQYNHNTWWCGTAGCAAGHAATIREFREAGFTMFTDYDDDDYDDKDPSYGIIYRTSDYKVYLSMNAISEFFGLEYEDARKIFGGAYWSGDSTPKNRLTVIQQLQDVLAGELPAVSYTESE
jgi:hypothetical protein